MKAYKLFSPLNRLDLRRWLQNNHQQVESIWVQIFKKGSGRENITGADLTEEALCFGWIDSVPGKIDSESFKMLLSPRKPGSPWSAINKRRTASLIKNKQMTMAGLQKIQAAKKDGSWNRLKSSDALVAPKELVLALNKSKKAKTFFESLTPGSKKIILEWIGAAKTEETKSKRIAETVRLAKIGVRANHFRDLKDLKKDPERVTG